MYPCKSDPSSSKRGEASAPAGSSQVAGHALELFAALGISPPPDFSSAQSVPPIVVLPSTPTRSIPAHYATPGTSRAPASPASNGAPQSIPVKDPPRGIPIPAPLDERLNVTEARKKLVLTKEKLGPAMEISKRPGFVTLGREARVNVNCFKVMKYPSQVIWQYDVSIGDGAEKRGLIAAVWASKRVSASLTTAWIFDGNQLAW